jgi:lipopolysaccharide/colanic/teichoic acid biosynthesis glycosyltransferase
MLEVVTRMYCGFFKRVFDIVLSLLGLIILSPVFLIVWFLDRRKLGSPAVFRQVRPGLHGQTFTLMKFRTMRVNDPAAPLSDAERLTPFGRKLRSSSLDELPELWNVLRGQMSLVGPRPLLVEYLPLYSPAQARRHEVRPGVTGWAQVNGRNALNWEERFELDVWYVDHCSLSLDLKIMWRTVAPVFKREGISSEGEATMPPFQG